MVVEDCGIFVVKVCGKRMMVWFVVEMIGNDRGLGLGWFVGRSELWREKVGWCAIKSDAQRGTVTGMMHSIDLNWRNCR